MTAILTASESSALAEHEAVIERGIQTFYEVGIALAGIRDRKLYRAEHGTFEDYCKQRWQISRTRAYELMSAATVVSAIADTARTPPANEAQARELGRVPEPQRAEVWGETLARTDGMPTAAAVRETFESTQPAPEENIWDELGTDEVVDAELVDEPARPEPPKAKRRPLPEAFADAGRDLTRAAERLARLTEDDRFTKNRETTHHQLPELLGALDHTAHLMQAMRLDQAAANEEARRWWATSLHKTSDALRDVANSLEQEQ